jgi:hypothetical protein
MYVIYGLCNYYFQENRETEKSLPSLNQLIKLVIDLQYLI